MEKVMIGRGWLRDRMRKSIGKSAGANSFTNALLSDLAKNSEQILVHRVNEILKGKNKHFAASDAEKIVAQAIRIAREKIRSAEMAKCAGETELNRYRDQAKRRLAAAEWRANAAEERANKAETSVRRLENELQTLRMRTRARLVLTAA
jgi:hypothetical protein